MPCDSFILERGLQQGDPQSPCLFILCAEVLSGLIRRAKEIQAIHGVRVVRLAPDITHLFFANDNIHFFRATQQEVETVQQILS